MLAARLHQPGGPVVIEEIPKPAPAEGEVLEGIEACGLCHSDLFIRSLETLPKTPLTLGHEAVGVVEESGPAAPGWRLGDRVALTYLYAGCGDCQACLEP
jgi:D-arabinose 1-dehydrogenase-like Zn-dependent alcohol dehydrogenase